MLTEKLKNNGGFNESELVVIKKALSFVLDGGHAYESGLTLTELDIARVIRTQILQG